MSIRYQQYLKSSHWKNLRRRILMRDRYTCQDCGRTDSLEVHHLCYRPFLEDALDSDLVTLCEDCHEQKHRRVVRPARGTVKFGVVDEKRRSLMDGSVMTQTSGCWFVRRVLDWLQN